MTFRFKAAFLLACLFAALQARGQSGLTLSRADPLARFRESLQKIAPLPPDPCASPNALNASTTEDEQSVFWSAATLVADALNGQASEGSPHTRATESLAKLEKLSAEVNAGWPNESRFHAQLLDLPPALVVKMTVRAQASFVILGIPKESSGKPNKLWQQVGSDDESNQHPSFDSWIDLYPLHRGPLGRARFLERFGYTGCAGSSGVVYEAQEWDPASVFAETIIEQEGSLGMDESPQGQSPTPKDPFAPIGLLRTGGPLITLPYCWFSAIDTWDNPSLCAVDTYDLSGDDVRFVSRAYNRPDLVPVAKSIEYATHRDYPATLGYCASSELARRMVRELPPSFAAEDLQVTRIAEGKERVKLGADSSSFVVEKRGGQWLVVVFEAE